MNTAPNLTHSTGIFLKFINMNIAQVPPCLSQTCKRANKNDFLLYFCRKFGQTIKKTMAKSRWTTARTFINPNCNWDDHQDDQLMPILSLDKTIKQTTARTFINPNCNWDDHQEYQLMPILSLDEQRYKISRSTIYLQSWNWTLAHGVLVCLVPKLLLAQ